MLGAPRWPLVSGDNLIDRPWPLKASVAAAALVMSIAVLYGPVFKLMAWQWWTDPNWSHGFLVPVFAIFLLWRERRRWMGVPIRGSLLGLAGVAAAVALLILATLAAELFTTRFSFVLLLASLVLYLGGWRMLRAVAFPLSYLLLMIPWPGLIYAQVTLPLQFLASRWAAAALGFVHVPVLREGNLLILSNYTLEVAEACSGIRSLVSLITIAIAYVYLAERQMWVRVGVVAMMVPIAIVSNAFRIFGTGVLTSRVSPRLAQGFFHEFSGWLIFLTATVLMLGMHQLFRFAAGILGGARA
ncbi:MAG TPA: exosortase/archaeosortase family protein [Patescibacteria group bacterium]|nr:exosortase/archaeosortase family protein [Patescibacteria group bacterium]